MSFLNSPSRGASEGVFLPTLTFCNDIDFADWATYREVHHVLREEFGIHAQDSFWLFDPAGSDMALFKDSLSAKGPKHDELLEDIRAGHLAILHSAGNFSRTNTHVRPSRALITEGLAYLKEHADALMTWTNHGDEGDIQNIGGARPTYQQGDDPSSEVYILDILLQNGLRYFCTDYTISNTFTFRLHNGTGHPLLVREKTRSGHEITCFFRYRGALPKAPDAQTLHVQLSAANLDQLTESRGVTVIYQHWCTHRDHNGKPFTASRPVFPAESMAALRRLAACRDKRLIAVPTLTECLRECDSALIGARV